MKIRVVGGPIKGTSVLEVKEKEKFEDIFKKIVKAVEQDNLWEQFQLHPALLVDEGGSRRVRPLPHVIQAQDTSKSLELPQDGTAFVMLRPLGAPPPALVPDKESAVTGESITPARNASSVPPGEGANNPNPGASYHDRLVAIYTKYQPEKLHTVNGTLKKFAGKEEAVIKQLVGKYGPEPRIEDAMREAAAANTAVAAVAAAASGAGESSLNRGSSTAMDRSLNTATPYASAAGSPEPSPREITYSAMTTPEPTPRENASATPERGTMVNPNPNASYSDRLTAIYTKYEPEKVHLVPGTLKKYAGREEAVVRSLVKKYGPEPVIGVDVHLPGATTGAADLEGGEEREASPPPMEETAVSAVTPPPAPPAASPVASAPPPTSETSLSSVSPVTGSPTRQQAAPAAPAEHSYRERLIAIYSTYHPEKLNTVEGNLRRFAGREEAMIQKLVQRYGPEPTVPLVTNPETPSAPPVVEEVETPLPTEEEVVAPMAAEVVEPEEPAAPVDATENAGYELTVAPETNQIQAEAPPVEKTTVMTDPEQPVPSPQPAPTESEPVNASDRTRTPSPVEAEPVVLGTQHGDEPPAPPSPTLQLEPITTSDPIQVTETAHVSPVATSAPPPPPASLAAVPSEEPRKVSTENVSSPPPPLPPAPSPPATPAVDTTTAPQAPPARRSPGVLGDKCAELLAERQATALQARAMARWLRLRDERKAAQLVNEGLWMPRGDGTGYSLADDVQPPYAVADLVDHVRQLRVPARGESRAFSDSMVLSLRAVLDALKTCLRSQAIDISSDEEKRLAEDFLRQWESTEALCPVHDSEQLAHALQQAARFLSQIEDLMNVTRSQDDQLGKLREMHEKMQAQPAKSEPTQPELQQLVEQLNESKKRQRSLEAALAAAKAASTAAVPPAAAPPVRSPRRSAVTSPRGGAASEQRPRPSPTELRQDAQIVHLQQELAKARSLVNRSKTFEEKLKQQLEESEERQMRLRRVVAATAAAEGTRSRSPRMHSARGATSHRAVSPRGGNGVAATYVPERASFSQPQVSPRRADPSAGTYYSPEARRPEAASLDQDEHMAVGNGGGASPWPKSRYVPPVPEIDRGPCPNCLTPLTSISPEVAGPANERAAFCFSCRRSFTFGELAHRDASSVPANGLSELWSSRQ